MSVLVRAAQAADPVGDDTATWAGPAARVVVIGAIPGCGASAVTWCIASAAAAEAREVEVLDAACPRRSVLRNLVPTVGAGTRVSDRATLVSARSGAVEVRFVEADLDDRVDQPAMWDRPDATARMQLVDVGVSAEEILTRDLPAAHWVTGPTAQESTIVLVLPTSLMSAARCEAVLQQWPRAGWAGIDQVVAVGDDVRPAAPLTPLVDQAFTSAHLTPWIPALVRHGLPEPSRTGEEWRAWAHAGHSVLAAADGRPAPTLGRPGRRWRRRG